MAISEALLPEFDQEMPGVRRTLERVPADKFEWRPHERSGTMIWLAGHLANIPSWAVLTIGQDALDLAPGGEPMPQPPDARHRRRTGSDVRPARRRGARGDCGCGR